MILKLTEDIKSVHEKIKNTTCQKTRQELQEKFDSLTKEYYDYGGMAIEYKGQLRFDFPRD